MLSIEHLDFSYKNVPIFEDFSVGFPAGSVSMIVGSSGSGKSTLLYLLGLLLTPTGGDILVNGKSTAQLSDAERSRLRATEFGFVFQDAALDPTRPIIDSVIEPGLYAGVSRKKALARAMELLELIGVDVRSSHRPGQISGGQAQRVAVARALVNNPNIILADEPTGNLDPVNARVVLDQLCAVARGPRAGDGGADAARPRSVIIVTHDVSILDRADQVVRLDDLVVASGRERKADRRPIGRGVPGANAESSEPDTGPDTEPDTERMENRRRAARRRSGSLRSS